MRSLDAGRSTPVRDPSAFFYGAGAPGDHRRRSHNGPLPDVNPGIERPFRPLDANQLPIIIPQEASRVMFGQNRRLGGLHGVVSRGVGSGPAEQGAGLAPPSESEAARDRRNARSNIAVSPLDSKPRPHMHQQNAPPLRAPTLGPPLDGLGSRA